LDNHAVIPVATITRTALICRISPILSHENVIALLNRINLCDND